MENNFYITTPIYYVNSHPHIGHAYTTIVSDVLRRFRRLFGQDTYFLTGTDEHGQKIVESAARSGISPQKFVDRISKEFLEMWPTLNIEYDQFIRTSDNEHKKCVQQILQKIFDQGEIFLKEYEGLYCIGCERFLDESELENGNCPDHQNPPEFYKEKNYFFRMSEYQEWLLRELRENEGWIYPNRYRNELVQFLKEPLQDLCISRPKSRLEWGIELPFDRNYVTYVWFDALLNYVSALDVPHGEKYKKYWQNVHHTIGKDILKTHGIYWPCMLKAAGLPVFKKLVVHGHWVVDGSKMSKSLGNAIDPLTVKEKIGVDSLRYFLLRDMSFGEDSNYTEDLAIRRYNSDLANNFGNLLNRSISMSRKNFDGCIPPLGQIGEMENELRDLFTNGVKTFQERIFDFQPHRALEHFSWLSSQVNKYIDNSKPWNLAKKLGERDRLATVLYTALDMSRILVGLLAPVMPKKMDEAMNSLGLRNEEIIFENLTPGFLESGKKLPEPSPLFPKKLESNLALKNGKDLLFSNKKNDPKKVINNFVDYKVFQEIELRVGLIRECQKIEKSSKLLCSKVDIGEGEHRSIISGVAKFYSPKDLVGKKVIVVSNLKPAKFLGVLSEGMILFSDDNGNKVLIEVPNHLKPGMRVS